MGILAHYVKQGIFKWVVQVAVEKGILDALTSLTPGDLAKLGSWCKKDGKDTITKFEQYYNLWRRVGGDVIQVQDLAYVGLLDWELAELNDKSRKERKYWEAKFKEARKRMCLLRHKLEVNLENIRNDFPMASRYKLPEDTEVISAVWSKYEEEVEASTGEKPQLSDHNLKEALHKYGTGFAREHKLRFCENLDVRAHLHHSAKHKIKEYEESGDYKKVLTLRNLMEGTQATDTFSYLSALFPWEDCSSGDFREKYQQPRQSSTLPAKADGAEDKASKKREDSEEQIQIPPPGLYEE